MLEHTSFSFLLRNDYFNDDDDTYVPCIVFFLTDNPTQSSPENTTVSEQAVGTTTTPLQMDHQLVSDNVATQFTFSAVTDSDIADLGVAPLPPQALSKPTPPCTYSVIFDNLDFFCRTHHQSIHRTNKSIHWIHHIAVEDRVSSTHLDRHKPTRMLRDYDIGKSLPSQDTQALIRRDYVILGSRILTEYLQAFKPLTSVVINHIPHQYSAEMSEPSTHVSVQFTEIKKKLFFFPYCILCVLIKHRSWWL